MDGRRRGRVAPACARGTLRIRPILTFWLGTPPDGLPDHARTFERSSAILSAVTTACGADVGGMRLAPGGGVELLDGTLMRGATIDALIGAHPRGFALPVRTFRTAGAALARHDAGWTLGRDGNAGVALVPTASEARAFMRANAEVLILEDDAETLDELQLHFTRKRFHPLAARSASRALSLLEHNRNQPARTRHRRLGSRQGSRPSASSGDVLSRLARELRECPVIVYSQNIDAFNVRSQIQRSHPRALLHDKRDGDASLLDRVDRMLDRTVDDLRIHDGTVVVHMPTLDEHHHREAIRLVVHHPDIVTFHSDTATKAVRRFGEWLRDHDFPVRLVSHGNRKYRLTVTASSGGGAPDIDQ